MTVLAAVVLLFSGRFIISKMTNHSNAMSARVIEPSYSSDTESSEPIEKKEDVVIEYMTEEELLEKDILPRTEKTQAEGFQEELDCFLVTNQDAVLYARNSTKANELAVLPKGTYVESYGHDSGWTKVSSIGREGYIKDQYLDVVSDSSLFKVVEGKLIVNKRYGLPSTYETEFNAQAASAMRVMLEAMEREGLSLEVATTYRSAPDEAKELVLMGNPVDAPESGHTVFQTGYGVQFYIAGTDPRLDNHFELTDQFAWLRDHAYEYGFILRYPEGSESTTGYRSDPTIFIYVGIEDAGAMMEEKLTLEEYYGVE